MDYYHHTTFTGLGNTFVYISTSVRKFKATGDKAIWSNGTDALSGEERGLNRASF